VAGVRTLVDEAVDRLNDEEAEVVEAFEEADVERIVDFGVDSENAGLTSIVEDIDEESRVCFPCFALGVVSTMVGEALGRVESYQVR